MVHQKAQIKRYRRFHGYDYSRGATLFITIATEPRRPLFGRIVDARPLLTPLGDDVLAALEAIPKFNPGFILFSRVVMPDHVHFRIYFPSGLAEPLAPIREHRMLEIGRGNDEVDFSRGACLDLNAEIIEIATAETDLALYWRADGPRILTQS